jgi:hypothetical protein
VLQAPLHSRTEQIELIGGAGTRAGVDGCSIYSERPAYGRSFTRACLLSARELGDEWFPARCRQAWLESREEREANPGTNS